MPRIVLLGASSWIGYKLGQVLSRSPSAQVFGTYHSSETAMPWLQDQTRLAGAQDVQALFDATRPDLVVNLLRGEDPAGEQTFRETVRLAAAHDSRYVYFSSSLALDGYPDGTLLTDDLAPNSVTPYGKFKSMCEHTLSDALPDRHLNLRFNSIQGWVPHRKTRNQVFLERLCADEEVTVDRGVVQSRLLDDTFIDMVVALIDAEETGTVHLASRQKSEEVDYLRKVAAAFGHDPAQVVSGAQRQMDNALTASSRGALSPWNEDQNLTDETVITALTRIDALSALSR